MNEIIKITAFYKFNSNEIGIIKGIRKNDFVFDKVIYAKILIKNIYNHE